MRALLIGWCCLCAAVLRAGEVQPELAFDGANYLVAWADGRHGPLDEDIYGARVTTAGTVLDPSGIPISRAANYQRGAAVAFDGSICLVVWTDSRQSSGVYDVYGTRVAPSGTVLDPGGIPVSVSVSDQEYPSVAWGDSAFLAAWHDGRNGATDIYAARVLPDGVVRDTAGIAVSTAASYQNSADVAFDGANYLVAWDDFRSGSPRFIFAARVTPSGQVLDPSGIQVCLTGSGNRSPAVCYGAGYHLVVWVNTYGDIAGCRVTPGGAVVDTYGIVISQAAFDQLDPDVAFDGTDFLVVWADGRSGSTPDIYAARVTPGGVVMDTGGIPVSVAADIQFRPAVAFGDSGYLVVWQDRRDGVDYHVYGARVAPDGEVLDPEGVRVSGLTAIEDEARVVTPHRPDATLLRGVLRWEVDGRRQTGDRAELLDASGRKVMDLRPGANDVRQLPSGVYLIRQKGRGGHGFEGSSVKVVIQR